MSNYTKDWVKVRELSEDTPSRVSYVRFQDIERVAYAEKQGGGVDITISAKGEEYLYNRVDNQAEAERSAIDLLDSITTRQSN